MKKQKGVPNDFDFESFKQEAVDRQLRKVTKAKGAFASENAMVKLIYLASMRIMDGWKAPPTGWRASLQQLKILFDDRIMKHQNDTV